jgi:tRNA(adenine34) deaminase
MKLTLSDDLWFMTLAQEQAEMAYRCQEVPVGALIVSPEGEILSKQFNQKEASFNPTGHAEILSIVEASKRLGNWRLNDCSLYVTLEPCFMCAGALVQSRIGRVVYGAHDPKGGALKSLAQLGQDDRLNHRFEVTSEVLQNECSAILKKFFKAKRRKS